MVQTRKNRLHSLSALNPHPNNYSCVSEMTMTTRPHPTSLSLSARYFNFLLKPNHCFHHCISSYPPKPIFSFHSLREHDVMPSWRDHNDRAKHNLKHLICTKGYSDQVPDIANQQDREAHVLRGMQCGPRR
ncbi:hypothetical protein AAZX31_06G128200 [Glycine max]